MDQEFKPIEDIIPPQPPKTNETLQDLLGDEPDGIDSIEQESVTAPEPVKTVETSEPVVETSKPKSVKKGSSGAPFVIALIIILIAAGIGAYFWRDMTAKDTAKTQDTQIATLTAKVTELEDKLANLIEPDNNEAPSCVAVAPTASTIENIKASVTSRNTAALEGYMAADVEVVLAASEAYGPQTSTQAVSDVTSFIGNNDTTWDFEPSLTQMDKYQAGDYATYFKDISVIGLSADSRVISFSFDCNGKINMILISNSEDILI